MSLRTQFLICGVFAALFLAVTAAAGHSWLRGRAELATHRQNEAQQAARLRALEHRLQEQDRFWQRLQHDPVLIERTIRQRLGYARPGEIVFRFPED